MSKRFILSGYYGFKNFGDEAILSVLVNKLQSDKHHITIISSDPEYTKSKFKNIRCVNTFEFKEIFGFISESDCLISGGGSLLQDVTSIRSLLYYLFIIFIALVLRKKVIIFAQGIGPIKTSLGRILTGILLKFCTYVSVRDIKSREILSAWGIKSDLVCDPYFSTKIQQTEKDGSISVQLRACKTLTKDFIDRLALKIFLEFKNKPVKIFPFQHDMDIEVCKKFEKAIKLLEPDTKITVMENLTDERIITEITKSDYLIAMRFHAIITGIIGEVRTLGINYDVKVEKLCKEFNLPYIEINKEFRDEFEKLKNIDITEVTNKVQQIKFDWSGFDKTLKEI